ncbi:hypothetical protein STEG23_035889, partial [Scotinomys teguina]
SSHRVTSHLTHSWRWPPNAHACALHVCRLHPNPWPAGLTEWSWGRRPGGLCTRLAEEQPGHRKL